jgi:DNA-binding MarR family transcriptional regulator
VPRLDAERVVLWRRLQMATAQVDRSLDVALSDEHGLTLRHFEVLTELRAAGGSVRVGELCTALGERPSTLSRRLGRMEDDGLVIRRPMPTVDDGRAVTVTITPGGRVAWREANASYRRQLQRSFAQALTDTDVSALQRILGRLAT